MRSSYQENNYGAVLQTVVRMLRANTIVELGVLDGYSTLHLARAAKWCADSFGEHTMVFAFDLFEDYQYKHGSQEQVSAMLAEKKVLDYVVLEKADAFQIYGRFADRSVDLLHIDISNDGQKLLDLLQLWAVKVVPHLGWVLLEGGSKERDAIAWMRRYSKRPIRELFDEPFVQSNFYPHMVLNKFPSMTLLQRRSA